MDDVSVAVDRLNALADRREKRHPRNSFRLVALTLKSPMDQPFEGVQINRIELAPESPKLLVDRDVLPDAEISERKARRAPTSSSE